MNGKPPKFTSTWKTIPTPQFDAKGIYRKELAPPHQGHTKATPKPHQSHTKATPKPTRSEEHTSELQSLRHLVCRLLLEKKKKITNMTGTIKLRRDSALVRLSTRRW